MTFEKSNESPHHFFAQLAGNWRGTSKLWLEPDTLAGETPIVGTIQLILEGRFALFLYQSSIEGEAQHGMFTFGYNTLLDRYETSWVDSFSQQHRHHVLHRQRDRERLLGPRLLP
ncbi:MAG: DUF1579 family protein [Anaerolineales bacterium]|uniref:DUF1579 family protein n=1 Tax=Candidatus Villigracilis vicinus TaxID=3140679 RepID=UPI003134B589|nr:DUF1579 family protein [Anaerolineales bacterium]